jgi:hypothetical protein
MARDLPLRSQHTYGGVRIQVKKLSKKQVSGRYFIWKMTSYFLVSICILFFFQKTCQIIYTLLGPSIPVSSLVIRTIKKIEQEKECGIVLQGTWVRGHLSSEPMTTNSHKEPQTKDGVRRPGGWNRGRTGRREGSEMRQWYRATGLDLTALGNTRALGLF